jgi:membrane protease YdiL (CAAX protease family)
MNFDHDISSTLPPKLVIPGVVLFGGLELLVLSSVIPDSTWLRILLVTLMLILPWLTLWFSTRGIEAFGFKLDQFFLHFGWGMVAGGFWRVVSILLNLWGLQLNGVFESVYHVFVLILWVPFVEETFFRGYVGRVIIQAWGPIAGIIIQAILFSLLPSHTTQGAWNMVSIFTFGLLAGWLMYRRDSIWAPWGAHAFANVLPLLMLA